ncbi:MAG: TolC family protein [Colwellia sp.]|uniref:TolC family protein n=1 Tax=Colwellia sp. TaxID=56799 RepID=UPI001D8DB767|nr:TolC family protein [Colwellia sp.]NQY48048.1 TolC family protein [Colwellia sp.]
MKFFSVKSAGVALFISYSATMSVSCFAFAQTTLSSDWLDRQINKHPDIVSARERMNAEFSKAQGSKLPLYNPELSTGYEREGDGNNFNIGISQTIDLWDKQAVNVAIGDKILTVASNQFTYAVVQKKAQALTALINWQLATDKSVLAFEQEQQLDILLKIVTKRQQAGDLGPVDAELTFLNLSQLLNKTAQIQAQLTQAQADVNELLPDWRPDTQVYPEQGLGVTNFQVVEQWLTQHPQVLAAQALWQVQKNIAQYAMLETKADPTIGLSAGKNADDNIVGITFSMPLNIRNDYQANAKAKNQQAIAAEASFRAVMRKQKYLIQASTASLISNKKYLGRWQKLMQGRGEHSAQLLQKQWQLGDLNTSDYLLALQQRAEGLYAGIELQAQFKLSEVQWLLNVGQLNVVTKLLN